MTTPSIGPARVTGSGRAVAGVAGAVVVGLLVWSLAGAWRWWQVPPPIRLHDSKALELTAYARQALAGAVDSQAEPASGLQIDHAMVGWDVSQVTRRGQCLLVDFHLPWFDGPIWALIFAPQGLNDIADRLQPPYVVLEHRDFQDGWHFLATDVH